MSLVDDDTVIDLDGAGIGGDIIIVEGVDLTFPGIDLASVFILNSSTTTGTPNDDVLLGTSAANIINAIGGQDQIFGFGGDDILNGGDGNDYLNGGAGNDLLDGGAGDDYMTGDRGNDMYIGGDGWDRISYARNGELGGGAVAVDLAANSASDGFGYSDTLSDDVESVVGSEFADTIMGDENDNEIVGLGGNDILDGAGGWDTLSYHLNEQWRGAGVWVDLALGKTLNDGFGGMDTISNFETVQGSTFGDKLVGNYLDNEFIGLAGTDIIDGAGGWDAVTYEYDGEWGASEGVTVDLVAGTAIDRLRLRRRTLQYRGSSRQPVRRLADWRRIRE